MTDPAEFSRQEKEQEGTEETKEQRASRKLEENLGNDEGSEKPKHPEEAKREQGEEDPY
ncbi:Hypothetical Protein RradSPS_0411 [Rubrobacter radiotolerans]|uniref:Uncharacterized protein n=1 Tax=Rubrobacter radiotolerans TaxID=42256 RepID=A0A023X0V2_RUBRA|nr:hypothetical protein [Rubrobacter radiotolerans]AHY45694.1 Hypothetical Protein RradSPS_0411 [Rubrobacter radiotolerans]MDX5893108.1 hypothetical protein [Rubrobacter radiotolerans]SMC03071.1 conserved hypothetical protein [Rubrobacter radiotolerans DSM 5868]